MEEKTLEQLIKEALEKSKIRFNEKLENIRTSLKALAKHFELNPEIIEEIRIYSYSKLTTITTIHKEISGSKLFYIFQSDKLIEIGELTKNSSINKFLKKV